MDSIKTSLYSNLINQGILQLQLENPNQSIQDDSSKMLTFKLNPSCSSSSSSSLSIEIDQRTSNPKSILDIISPKSTSTPFDSKVDPFEFFGQQRSRFIQRDLIQSNQHSNPTPDLLQVDEPLKHKVDHFNLSTFTLLEDSIQFQLDDLTKSFEKSTHLVHSDLQTPIQSFQKFKPSRSHSRIMNQSDPTTHPDQIPHYCVNSNQVTSEEIMKEFLSPSYSIEEENPKVKNLIIQEIQRSSNPINLPILSFKGEPISNLIIQSNDSPIPLISRKRKPSDLIDESDHDHHSSRIKISNHSKKQYNIKSDHLDVSIPSLDELRATMPASSRRYYQHSPNPNKRS